MSSRGALLGAAVARLEHAGIEDAPREARLLMRWASGMDAASLNLHLDAEPDVAELAKWTDGLSRRCAREPLSHVTGSRLFWGREFLVTADVLDPRPETEVLIAEALRRGPFARVLDLGTGSGCIVITLLAEWAGATAVGVDMSAAALDITRRNADTAAVPDRLEIVQGSWFERVTGQFDLIISNPPYLTVDEMTALAPEVRDHEPALALTPGGDGLGAYRAIAVGLPAFLAPGGSVMLEIGPTQSNEVAELLEAQGLQVPAVVPDLDQRPRVVVAHS